MTAAIDSAPHLQRTAPASAGSPSGSITDRPARLPYLMAVPDSEPPFDDDPGPTRTDPGRPPSAPPVARATSVAVPIRPHRALAPPPVLARHASAGLLAAVPAPAELRGPTTIVAAGIPSWSSESDIGVRKTSTEQLPSADRSASVLARGLVEVLSGRRPLAQLRVHCAPEVYAGLVARPATGPLALPHLLTVRVCEPADGVAEVSAAFRRADRVRALAFRLQGVDGRWRITALQLG
ncbi:MAG: Rv3235 family protein [Nakamurella sp.]